MKAVLFHAFGEAGVLQLDDEPVPAVRPHDLLVRVRAAGVDGADLTHHRGGYGCPGFGDWRMAMPIPEGLDVHAASSPEVFVTAHEAALHLGRPKQGDALLVHAAAGDLDAGNSMLPVIDRTFALAHAADGHRRTESSPMSEKSF